MATQAHIDRILAAIREIRAVPLDDVVVNREKWGPFTFEAARTDLELIFSMATHLSSLPIEILPDNFAEQIAVALEACRESIKKLIAFDPKQGNPNDMQQRLTNEAKSHAQQLLVSAQGWIPFLAYQRGDVQKNIDELSNAVQQARQVLNAARESTAQTKGEIDGIVVAAREAAASAGVGVFTSDFAGQAETLEAAAENWLKLTGVFGGATILLALASAFVAVPDAQLIQYMSSKVVILVTLLTATIWCGRVYKATKHQAATNSHRANSLRTFQAFVKAASDNPTRDAVLLESTRSIFALAASGYLDASEPAADTGTKVLEIFKGSRA